LVHGHTAASRLRLTLKAHRSASKGGAIGRFSALKENSACTFGSKGESILNSTSEGIVMAHVNILMIPRLDDKALLDLFRSIQNKQKPNLFNVMVSGLPNINFLDVNEAKSIARVDSSSSFVISKVSFNYPGFHIEYTRGGSTSPFSPLYDEIKFTHPDHQQSALPVSGRLDVLQIINDTVGPSPMAGMFAPQSTRGLDDLEALYRSTVLRLETKFAEQIEKITSWTVEQTAAFEKKKLELTEEGRAERSALQAEYEIKQKQFQQEAEALEQRRKQLDDRDYMHARRGIRADLQKIVAMREEKFSLTPSTRRLRTPVHILMLALIAFLLVLNGLYLNQFLKLDLNSSPTILIWSAIKQGLLAAILVGAMLYYVRWMNRWFEEHAHAEFLLKQFQLDIDRASWVVETALEWRRDQKAEIPSPLLEGITRNLFAQRETEEKGTGVDDLASALVGNASGVKLKLGDSEVSLDRKGLSKLAKAET
jgi:hypothetical protein